MKVKFSDIKSKLKLGQNGSPVLAIILFAVAFFVTMWVLGGNSDSKIDGFELGQSMREAVNSENGEVVATINEINYHERDFNIIKINLFADQAYYYNLKESKQRAVVGDQLVRQFMIIQEFDRLGLTLTEEECDEYIESERKSVLELISDEDKSGKSFLEYIEGYGCSFDTYWSDKDVRESYVNSLKYNKALDEICRLNGKTKMSLSEINSYLTQLIKDGVYTITLFGEPFGTSN